MSDDNKAFTAISQLLSGQVIADKFNKIVHMNIKTSDHPKMNTLHGLVLQNGDIIRFH